jgi:hypothetical protein
MKKTWQQKYDGAAKPKVETLPKGMFGAPAGSKMLISSPKEVEQVLRELPAGTRLSIGEFRTVLAARHGADVTCPMTASIFLRIVAERNLELLESGTPVEDIAPFWRAIPVDSPLAMKLSIMSAELRELAGRHL